MSDVFVEIPLTPPIEVEASALMSLYVSIPIPASLESPHSGHIQKSSASFLACYWHCLAILEDCRLQ